MFVLAVRYLWVNTTRLERRGDFLAHGVETIFGKRGFGRVELVDRYNKLLDPKRVGQDLSVGGGTWESREVHAHEVRARV